MKKKIVLNTVMPLILELVTIISGFILPRLILTHYGSEVNGLVQSITQFLSIISFFEAGVGSVVRYNFFKPLAEHNDAQISRVVVSANRFFHTLAIGLLAYSALLMIFYPMFARTQFSHMYTALLIAAMVISSFAEYYFGQVNQLLLNADQKAYIQYTAQILTIIANTAACIILIRIGAGIHVVKLTASIIFLARPLFLNWYVKKHYNIDYSITYDDEPIKQKWNGFAQHLSAVVLCATDVVVLTLFSTLENVSVYSVYYLVVAGVLSIVDKTSNGVDSAMGKIIAQGDKKMLDKAFSLSEWALHTVSTFLFTCTIVLVVPFIEVYTLGVNDANYIVPLFAMLITVANMFRSFRLPYSIAILTAGHYKQTQKIYITGAVMNIVISIALVIRFSLVGVAVGTIAAMFYQTIRMAQYSYSHILFREKTHFLKQISVDAVSVLLAVTAAHPVRMAEVSYSAWIVMGIKCAFIVGAVILVLNMIFYREQVKSSLAFLKKR